jgi:hypothetical protein
MSEPTAASDEQGAAAAAPPAARRLVVGLPWLCAMAAYYLAVTVLTHFHKLAGAGALGLGLVLFARPLGRLLARGLLEPWRAINERAAAARVGEPARHFDYRPLVVMCTVAVSLTLIEYYGDRNIWDQIVTRWLPWLRDFRYFELSGFAYWSAARVVGYVAIPFLVVLFMPGERLRDYGLSPRGFSEHVWIYGLLFLVVVPAVVMVSYTKAFQHTYPFYKLAARSWTDCLGWELFYSIQFFALEVFFRGFMLHALKRPMGAYAVFAMIVPYCMIHYNKPIAEVLGAVAAGTVLGTLSLHTGSIWCGVLIHVSVALGMDALAMFHTVGFPGNPRLVLS